MRVQLSDVCDVLTGFTARGRLEESSEGVLTIQMRDVSEAAAVKTDSLIRLNVEGSLDRYLVKAGDVVFRSRGERNTAALLGDDFTEAAVAILPILIIRAKPSVLPSYLVWAINQAEAQRYFDSHARGETIRMIPKPAIEALEIDLPDLKTQATIVEVDALAQREAELATELVRKRRSLVSESLQTVIKKSPSGRKK